MSAEVLSPQHPLDPPPHLVPAAPARKVDLAGIRDLVSGVIFYALLGLSVAIPLISGFVSALVR